MWENMVEPDSPDDNIVLCGNNVICPLHTKATNTRSEYMTLVFHGNDGYMNTPQCNMICTLPLLSLFYYSPLRTFYHMF